MSYTSGGSSRGHIQGPRDCSASVFPNPVHVRSMFLLLPNWEERLGLPEDQMGKHCFTRSFCSHHAMCIESITVPLTFMCIRTRYTFAIIIRKHFHAAKITIDCSNNFLYYMGIADSVVYSLSHRVPSLAISVTCEHTVSGHKYRAASCCLETGFNIEAAMITERLWSRSWN